MPIAPLGKFFGTLARGGGDDQGLVRGRRSAPQDKPRCGCCLSVVAILKVALQQGRGHILEPRFRCACNAARRCHRCERCLGHCECDARPVAVTAETILGGLAL